MQAVQRLLAQLQEEHLHLDFLTPLHSTVLAVLLRQGKRDPANISLAAGAQSYADTIGLTPLLGKPTQRNAGGQREGQTYSRLNCLEDPPDVDPATGRITKTLRSNLHRDSPVAGVARAVGELHDNVHSHARGIGFSAVQVYQAPEGRSRVEMAVVDGGDGLLRVVKAAGIPNIETDAAAIEWCIQEGNTTRTERSDYAQWVPPDMQGPSPFPPEIETFTDHNTHVGAGLSSLVSLVRGLPGSRLELRSGNAWHAVTPEGVSGRYSRYRWDGLLVDVRLILPSGSKREHVTHERAEKLRRRLEL